MRTSNRRYYSELDHWRKYERFLPAAMQVSKFGEPTEEFWSWHGGEIHLDRYESPTSPLTVMMLHGGGGNGRLLAPYGLRFRHHGFDVVAPDLPGYGLSLYSKEMFAYEQWACCVSDLVETERQRTGKPVVLFGLSLGGYLAYLAAAKGRNVAGIIATTLADPRLPIVKDQFARSPWVNRMLNPLLPLAAFFFGNLRLPIQWFSNMEGVANDPELCHLLCSDPIGGGNLVPLSFMHSLFAIRPAIEPENFDVCPLLLAQPAADRWTTIEASKPFFDRIKGSKSLVMLENCGHLPLDEPGVTQLEKAAIAFLKNIHAVDTTDFPKIRAGFGDSKSLPTGG